MVESRVSGDSTSEINLIFRLQDMIPGLVKNNNFHYL